MLKGFVCGLDGDSEWLAVCPYLRGDVELEMWAAKGISASVSRNSLQQSLTL
jgi:hypothetical protein